MLDAGRFYARVYRTSCPVYLFFVIVIAGLFASLSWAEEPMGVLPSLLERSRTMRLHEDRYWDVLLQYKPSGRGKKSLVDDPDFFFAPDGKTNPEAELNASLTAFFSTDHLGNSHPRCRFPARYEWLRQRLEIPETLLPFNMCERLNEALLFMQPKTATLVFPAAHNNSPASMFGHTLIRIDSRPRSDLLSHAATYAAVADDRNNILYAFKGIFGFYRGYYSNLPYYEKVAEYNDIERRDIWEYELNLTEDEVYRMVLYIWELQEIYSDYYFFDENCSYNLLFLLEAARPSLRLTDEVGKGVRFWVIPVDTIRAVKRYGLVKGVRYRPSRVTRILFMASRMPGRLQDAALELSSGRMDPGAFGVAGHDAAEQAQVLDLAAEVLQYEFSLDRIEKDVYLKRYLAVLKARSSLGAFDSDASAIPAPTPPDEGHSAGRIGISAGYRRHSAFAEIGWQPAYHDLMDPDPGYVPGSQIKFLDIRVRHYIDDGSLKLQGINVIDIVSLSDRTKFYKPVSWKVNTGLERMILSDGRDHLVYRLNFGRGISIATGRSGLAYAMAEADMKYTGVFDSRYAAGIGASLGVLASLTDSWKLHLSAQKVFHMLGDDHRYTRCILDQSLTISKNNSLRISLLWEEGFSHSISEQQLSWLFFF